MKIAANGGLIQTRPLGNFITRLEPYQIIEAGKSVNFYHNLILNYVSSASLTQKEQIGKLYALIFVPLFYAITA